MSSDLTRRQLVLVTEKQPNFARQFEISRRVRVPPGCNCVIDRQRKILKVDGAAGVWRVSDERTKMAESQHTTLERQLKDLV